MNLLVMEIVSMQIVVHHNTWPTIVIGSQLLSLWLLEGWKFMVLEIILYQLKVMEMFKYSHASMVKGA